MEVRVTRSSPPSSPPTQPNLFWCPRSVGTRRSRAGVFFLPTFGHSSLSPLTASAQPPVRRRCWDHLLQQVWLQESPLSLPPSPPSGSPFLPLTDSRSPVRGQSQRGAGLSSEPMTALGICACDWRGRAQGRAQGRGRGGARGSWRRTEEAETGPRIPPPNLLCLLLSCVTDISLTWTPPMTGGKLRM